MIAVAHGAGLHAAGVRAVTVFGQRETTDAFARDQSRQPARMLLGTAERMNRIDGERSLDRGERAQARVGPFQFQHDEAVGRLAQPGAAVFFQVRRIKAQRAHARRELFRKLARAMAGHDLGHDFLLHKTPRPIARGAFFIGEKFFDIVVIQ